MGWAAGTEVFNRTARAFIDASSVDDDATDPVLTALAEALTDAGWDTVDESVTEFRDWPEIVAVLCRVMGDRDVAGRFLGTIGFDDGLNQWALSCPEHGELGRGDGDSVEAHDLLVREWAAHDRDHHGGDGVVDVAALIDPV